MKYFVFFLGFLLLVSCSKEPNKDSILSTISSKYILEKSNGLFNKQLEDSLFSKFYLKNNPEKYRKYYNLTININKEGDLTYIGTPVNPEDFIEEVTDFIDFAAEGKTTMLHLNFDKNTSLHNFNSTIKLLTQIKSDQVIINSELFVYELKKLPDCDCSL